MNKIILIITFLYLGVDVTFAGQIGPKGSFAKKLVQAIQNRDAQALQALVHPNLGIRFTYSEESSEEWLPKFGNLRDSKVARLLFDTDFMLKTYQIFPPDKSKGPLYSLAEALTSDFFSQEQYLIDRNSKKFIIDGKGYGIGYLDIYYQGFSFRVDMYCTTKSHCYIHDFYVQEYKNSNFIFSNKACSTDKDMYGKPMKKTMCPDH